MQVLVPLAVGAALIVPRFVDRGPQASATDGALSLAGHVATVSGPLPAISGTTLAGGTFGPADYRGRILVVNVWNPDCPPCGREAPALAAAQAALSRAGNVVFVGVVYVGGSWPNDPDAARSFLRTYGLTYPGVIDQGSRLATALGIPGIPVTVVADATGAMRYRITGGVEPGQLERLVGGLSG